MLYEVRQRGVDPVAEDSVVHGLQRPLHGGEHGAVGDQAHGPGGMCTDERRVAGGEAGGDVVEEGEAAGVQPGPVLLW